MRELRIDPGGAAQARPLLCTSGYRSFPLLAAPRSPVLNATRAKVSRGVTPVTALCPVEASDIRPGIDESGERRNASREIHQSAATKFPTELRRAQARGTAFGSPVGPGDTQCASATHAASQDAPRYVGSCSDRDDDPGLGRMAVRAGVEAATHPGQRKISPGRVRTGIRSDVRKHLSPAAYFSGASRTPGRPGHEKSRPLRRTQVTCRC